jgi:PPOX class probable F420-dependent enzyme
MVTASGLTPGLKSLIEGKTFASIATINADGSPQVTPVWVEHDGTHLIVNSETRRTKVRNLRRDPRVAVSIPNAENPYEYAQVQGRVVEISEQGGAEGIDRLSRKYLGQDTYPYNQPDDVRVVIKIAPERVSGMAR